MLDFGADSGWNWVVLAVVLGPIVGGVGIRGLSEWSVSGAETAKAVD